MPSHSLLDVSADVAGTGLSYPDLISDLIDQAKQRPWPALTPAAWHPWQHALVPVPSPRQAPPDPAGDGRVSTDRPDDPPVGDASGGVGRPRRRWCSFPGQWFGRVSVDVLIGVHFRRTVQRHRDRAQGHRSQRCRPEAMGAIPLVVVIGFAAPGDLPVQWAREFMTGVREEADRAGVTLVGGDTSAARDISISATVIGQTGGVPVVSRSGAHAGQVVAFRGRLGYAAAGLAALGRGFRSPRAAVDAQRCPQPPYGAGHQAAQAGATAMIDVSDGLLADLGHIVRASDVAIDLDSGRSVIPDPVQAVAAATGRNRSNSCSPEVKTMPGLPPSSSARCRTTGR